MSLELTVECFLSSVPQCVARGVCDILGCGEHSSEPAPQAQERERFRVAEPRRMLGPGPRDGSDHGTAGEEDL